MAHNTLRRRVAHVRHLLKHAVILIARSVSRTLQLTRRLMLVSRNRMIRRNGPLAVLAHPTGSFIHRFFKHDRLNIHLLSLHDITSCIHHRRQTSNRTLTRRVALHSTLSLFITQKYRILPIIGVRNRPYNALRFRSLLIRTWTCRSITQSTILTRYSIYNTSFLTTLRPTTIYYLIPAATAAHLSTEGFYDSNANSFLTNKGFRFIYNSR